MQLVKRLAYLYCYAGFCVFAIAFTATVVLMLAGVDVPEWLRSWE